MSAHQDIVYNVASQTFVLDAPEGRPSSVTSVTVLRWDQGDDNDAETATTGAATVETNPDTTFDASSGVSQSDARVLNVAATTGVEVGRQYLATNAAGGNETIEVVSFVAAASITARHPLFLDYAAADTLESTRMTISVLDSWAADTGKLSSATDPNPGYRIRWVYVVGGVTYVRYSYASLVRAAGVHSVSAADIERVVPGYMDALPRRHQGDRGTGLIDEAHLQVTVDLHQQGIDDAQLRNQAIVDELVKRKAVVLWAEARAMLGGDDAAVEIARSAYQIRWDQLIRAPSKIKIPIDPDASGAGATRNAMRVTVR